MTTNRPNDIDIPSVLATPASQPEQTHILVRPIHADAAQVHLQNHLTLQEGVTLLRQPIITNERFTEDGIKPHEHWVAFSLSDPSKQKLGVAEAYHILKSNDPKLPKGSTRLFRDSDHIMHEAAQQWEDFRVQQARHDTQSVPVLTEAIDNSTLAGNPRTKITLDIDALAESLHPTAVWKNNRFPEQSAATSLVEMQATLPKPTYPPLPSPRIHTTSSFPERLSKGVQRTVETVENKGINKATVTTAIVAAAGFTALLNEQHHRKALLQQSLATQNGTNITR